MLARHPQRMLPFFVFSAIASGAILFDLLWRGARIGTRLIVGTIAIALLGIRVVQAASAEGLCRFKPYPQVPPECVECWHGPASQQATRVWSLVPRFSLRESQAIGLTDSLAGAYEVYSLNLYDPAAEDAPAFRHAIARLQRGL